MEDIYLQEEMFTSDSSHASRKRKENLAASASTTHKYRGVRPDIKSSFVTIEFSYRVDPGSLDDSRRARSAEEEHMDIDEETSGISLHIHHNLPI